MQPKTYRLISPVVLNHCIAELARFVAVFLKEVFRDLLLFGFGFRAEIERQVEFA